MSLLAELKDSLLLGDFDDIRNAFIMQNLVEQVHNLGSINISPLRGFGSVVTHKCVAHLMLP